MAITTLKFCSLTRQVLLQTFVKLTVVVIKEIHPQHPLEVDLGECQKVGESLKTRALT